MCEPISITLGVLSAVGAGASAIGQHQEQTAAIARSNAIAQQNYQQQLQITAARDQEAGRVYQAELKAATAAKNSYYATKSANQLEADRALRAVDQKLAEQRTASAFQSQKNIASAIQAQGSILSTGKAGQSFLLQAMDAERQLGFEQAQVDATLYDATGAANVDREGVMLDLASAQATAWNNLPADPLSPQASFLPIRPTMQGGPSKLALAGNLVGAAVSGASAGLSTYGSLKSSDLID